MYNDNQIKCTITKEDLESRNIKISELAYGSDNARMLFRDMMQQASNEVGFEYEDIPIMVEAIPVNSESLVLIITKVESPDELDTRFSHFTPSGGTATKLTESPEGADAILDLYKKMLSAASSGTENFIPLKDAISNGFSDSENAGQKAGGKSQKAPCIERAFSFRSFDEILPASRILCEFYSGSNSLYKNPTSGEYMLVVGSAGTGAEVFNKVCNILAEYVSPVKKTRAASAFLKEHCTLLRRDDALTFLSKI